MKTEELRGPTVIPVMHCCKNLTDCLVSRDLSDLVDSDIFHFQTFYLKGVFAM